MSNGQQLGRLAYWNNPVYGGPVRNRALATVATLGRADMQWGGMHYIAGEAPDGIVTLDGAPAQRMVRLVDRKSGIAVRQTMSNADGTYRFEYIDGSRVWMVIGIDQFDQENAVIADMIRAVPMPPKSPV